LLTARGLLSRRVARFAPALAGRLAGRLVRLLGGALLSILARLVAFLA
jgi:hypothetical protein